MERRTFLTLLTAGTAGFALSACGSDDSGQSATTELPAPPASDPPTVEPAPTAPLPEGAAEAVFEFGWYGGFTTRDIAFQMQPQVLITTDGQLITPAETTAVYPGPLLPADSVQTITPSGVEQLIAAARDAGLLAEASYESNQNIADASTATLRISVDGETYVHEAYALGAGGGIGGDFEEELAPGRQAFADFVALLGDLPSLVGPDELGPAETYVPDGYQLFAAPAGDLSGFDVEPTVLDWPADTGIVLADTSSCVELDPSVVGDVLTDATQLTFFAEAGVNYQVVARPAYPGRSC